ncbi:MAG TPA: bifunctional cobalt-precorrin-7 (C(5))-methyltransferase/cobalt-precorrin-6B (C(15))-methyltransferase [Lachnospiraceae bacterium]|nr:bifunctional cobalt-precorrin-7 (C(5))-methyltransferase/cobalt-precorrin-6B (C(15))-methyltransferase [Lachnospiraceae bacterium]
MKPVIIFAGTIEGRTLSEYLAGQKVRVTACVATEYGETLLDENEYLNVHTGRMNQAQMTDFIKKESAALVVDATHPYAVEVSENVWGACLSSGTEYLRLLRESDLTDIKDAVLVSSVEEAVEYLKHTDGNILATTGSKELVKYTVLPDYEKRVFARVLSTAEVASACEKLGFRGRNLICMQGPFSEALNEAMLRQFDCRYLVTKETGKAGGFMEKVRAAGRADAKLILVGRPAQKEGYAYEEVVEILRKRLGMAEGPFPETSDKICAAPAASVKKRVVTLVGTGMGTWEGMTGEAVSAIRDADLLIGAERMLQAAGAVKKPSFNAYDPQKISAYIAEHTEYDRVAILLSGDIGFYSGAKKLYDALDGCGYEIRSVCGVSSLVYLCGKLGVPWEDVCLKSTHGRKANLVQAVYTHKKTAALLSAKDSVKDLCRELQEYGLANVNVSIGERLGYEDEKISSGTPSELEGGQYGGLTVALIENPEAVSGIRSCIGDEEFLRGKAPMTKSEIRSLSVSKLRLTKEAVVYDVGAGTGSVTVEMALQAADGTVYAIERKEEACELIEKNKRIFGVPHIQVVCGLAPEALADLPAPTHAFIGGSAGNLKEIIECLLKKNPSVRLVINTVTLETIGEVTECLKTLPLVEEEIISVGIAKAKKVSSYHLMTGLNPIYIVTCKGGGQ